VDPVGPQKGWAFVVACYIKYVMLGVNYKNIKIIRSATCKGYAESVSRLFALRGYPNPVDLADESNYTRLIVHHLEREEDVAKQRKPLDSKIFAEAKRMADEASEDSLEAVCFNAIAVARILGLRRSEHVQTKKDEVDYHEYPSGKKVIKALIGNDIMFKPATSINVVIKRNTLLENLTEAEVTIRHQKNRQNRQKIRIVADQKYPDTCACVNLGKMIQRKRRLGHSMDLPLEVYLDDDGEVVYLTDKALTAFIRKVVKAVYPDISKEELMLYSCHSLRVWAAVLLHEAGKLPDFIKKRLRWLGESYRVYLRDTLKTGQQHNDALAESSQAVIDIIESPPKGKMEQISEIDLEESGEYDDND